MALYISNIRLFIKHNAPYPATILRRKYCARLLNYSLPKTP